MSLHSLLAAVRRTIRTLFLRRRMDRDVDEELRFHLDMSAAASIAGGMSSEDARLAARRAFGNPGRIADASRDIKRAISVEQLGFDLLSGWRTARRAPGVAVTAVIILALGIGSTTIMFSITHGILRDLPVDRPEQLVHLAAINRVRGWRDAQLSDWEFQAMSSPSHALQGVAGARLDTYHLGEPGRFAERWSGAALTPNAFRILRVTPALGRDFSEDDAVPGAAPVVILGDALWRQHFQGDPSIIGRATRVNGVLRTVIGVMRRDFRFPREQDLWIPERPAASPPVRGEPTWTVFGRLKDGVSLDAAVSEIAARDSAVTLQSANRDPERRVFLRSYRELQFSSKVLPIFGGMLLVVSFVLLIACANVAGLLLARGAGRRREMAVRAALGATGKRLTVQLLSEVLVLAIGGGVLGLMLAAVGVAVFNARIGTDLAFWMSVRVDTTVLFFTTVLVLAAAFLAGLAPARRSARADVGEALKSASRGSTGFRAGRLNRALVGFEVALSAALLVVTVLMVRGVRDKVESLAHVRPDELHVTAIELRRGAYPDAAAQRRFLVALTASLDATVGSGFGLSSALPGSGEDGVAFLVEGHTQPGDTLQTRIASTNGAFFHVFGATLLRGRELAASDDERAPPVVVIDQRFARQRFGERSPLGARIRLTPGDSTSPWRTIVGVMGDIEQRPAGSPDSGIVYLPIAQYPTPSFTISVRTTRQDQPVALRVSDAVRRVDREVTVTSASRFDDLLARNRSSERLFGGLFLFFGLSALLLASVGLGSLIALTLQQQRKELGIRLALGARGQEVAGVVLRAGLHQLLIGLAVGLALAVPIARTLGQALMGGDAADISAYAIAGVVLLLSGAGAAWIPVRRALRIAPSEVLRAE